MDCIEILECLETRLPDSAKFEEMVILHLRENYFALVYQAMYKQLGYNDRNSKFSTDAFKDLLITNNFLDYVNEVYRTRLSWEGLKEISMRLQQVEDFDDYATALQVFKGCDLRIKNGKESRRNAFSLGTKILHFYNPEENPILDSVVRQNLMIKGEMNKELCVEFREAARRFAKKNRSYFIHFNKSDNIKQELAKRHMTNEFPIMEILDMALYEAEK